VEPLPQTLTTIAVFSTDAWITTGVLVCIIGGLIVGKVGADLVMLSGLAVLMITGVLSPTQALIGFANPAVATIAALYVVAAGLRDTGAMTSISGVMLGRPKSLTTAQVRLVGPVALASAFVNNTPIVAMFLPVLDGWARRMRLSASMLYMPLSFATILGGMCTLIGTSTNLVVAGLMRDHMDKDVGVVVEPMGMFTLTAVGLPAAVIGLVYIVVASRFLLRDERREAMTETDPRQYMAAVRITKNSGIANKTVEGAGLRHLPGIYLSRIERGEEIIPAVSPDQILREGDVLVFVGAVEAVVDLQKHKGLEPADETAGAQPRHQARLIEAVVSGQSPMLNTSIREGMFRSRYNAVVLAVHRQGERIKGRLGDIRLRAGDTLLLEAAPEFAERFRDSRDFFLVSELPGAAAPRHRLAGVALIVMLGMVALITIMPDRALAFALSAALGMILLRCCTGPSARSSIDWSVLVVIGAAFGLARAMESTGLASTIAGGAMGWAQSLGPIGVLSAVYALTMLFTSIITNNAAAALMFPIALAAAQTNDMPMLPVAVCVAIAASAGFATPIGYQTNLMVMGPGGYRTRDYLLFGGPLAVLVGVVTVVGAALAFGLM